jgi:hypothetical protein
MRQLAVVDWNEGRRGITGLHVHINQVNQVKSIRDERR